MIIERRQQRRDWSRRWWQAAFVVLLAAVIMMEAAPELSANALYLLTDGRSAAEAYDVAPVEAERILVTGVEDGGAALTLTPGKKATVRRGGDVQYATTREDESVNELLARVGVSAGPLEMIRVDLSGDEVTVEIASDFTYYETATEAAAYTTVYETDYRLPKGETQVARAGEDGTREVTYEIVYADGELVSRQAVAEGDDTSVAEVIRTGTLVREAEPGDTIASVVREDDGGGYLLMASGDALHFTGSMDVKCTAYTTGYDGVGTTTYTGTTVHVGVVAVDKSVIPLGSKLFITTANGDYTYGMASAEDTGVRGKNVDLFMDTYGECIQFGRRSSVIYFLDN